MVTKEEELINARLAKPRGNQPYKRMSATMIAIYLTGYLNSQLSIRKISEVMRMKKYHCTFTHGVEYFHVIVVQDSEVQTHIQEMENALTFSEETSQLPDSE